MILREWKPASVVVFRCLQLGDLLCAVPALRALRSHLPRSRITLVGLPWARAFADRFSLYVDEFEEFPGYPGLSESPARPLEFPGFLRRIAARAPELAIQLHGSGEQTNPLVALLAPASAGYGPMPAASAGGYATGQWLPYPDDLHEIHRNLALLSALGVPGRGDELEYPVIESDRAFVRTALAARGLDFDHEPFACIHPGARQREKCWPPAEFAKVAEMLAASGLRLVITGSSAEADLSAEVRNRARIAVPPVDTTELDLPIGPLAAVIERARVVVCNDTGVSHLAAACRTPSVVIFRNADRRRWAPLDREIHRVVDVRDGGTREQVEAQLATLLRASAAGMPFARRSGDGTHTH